MATLDDIRVKTEAYKRDLKQGLALLEHTDLSAQLQSIQCKLAKFKEQVTDAVNERAGKS